MNKVVLLSGVLLAGCGSATVATSTPAPTAVPTQAPTQAPTLPPVAASNEVKCSFVVTYQGSEFGFNVDVQNAKVDSQTACLELGTALNGVRAMGATVQESDGVNIDYTQAGGDIKLDCAKSYFTVYEHSTDPVSVAMADGFCGGITTSPAI